MNFSNIKILYLMLVIIPLFGWVLLYGYKKYHRSILSLLTANLLTKMVIYKLFKIKKIEVLIYFIIIITLFFSLSGPQWGIRSQEIQNYGLDIVFLFDVSKSMLTEDIVPNRLEFAKKTARLFIERAETNRVAVITFAGTAFYHCPLTIDLYAAKELIDIIDTDIIPYPGTKIGTALEEVLRVLKDIRSTTKVVVLFSDGEDFDSNTKEVAKKLKENNIILYSVGVGTPEGKPIAIRDSSGKIVDYKKDKEGNVVTSKLNETLLYEIAEETSGRYFSSNYGEVGIVNSLTDEITNLKKSKLKSKIQSMYINRYYYFVYIALMLILIDIFVPKMWLTKL